MAGDKVIPLFRWLAVLFILGCFVITICGYTPTEAVSLSERITAVRAAVPADWNIINKRSVDKWIIKGEVLSANSPFTSQKSEEAVKERAISQGFRLMNSSGSASRRRLIFCRRSLALDVEINAIASGSTVNFGAYWAAYKTDSRFCRS